DRNPSVGFDHRRSGAPRPARVRSRSRQRRGVAARTRRRAHRARTAASGRARKLSAHDRRQGRAHRRAAESAAGLGHGEGFRARPGPYAGTRVAAGLRLCCDEESPQGPHFRRLSAQRARFHRGGVLLRARETRRGRCHTAALGRIVAAQIRRAIYLRQSSAAIEDVETGSLARLRRSTAGITAIAWSVGWVEPASSAKPNIVGVRKKRLTPTYTSFAGMTTSDVTRMNTPGERPWPQDPSGTAPSHSVYSTSRCN